MSTVRIVRFSKPSCLRQVGPALLLEFLSRHSGFFSRQGLAIPAAPDPDVIPYGQIAEAFMKLDAELDKNLIDALYHLDALSTQESADVIMERASEAGFPLPDGKPHPVDLVVRVWLQEGGPELIREVQDRLEVRRFRSFQFFPAAEGKPKPYTKPSADAVREACDLMRPMFDSKKRGEECVVTMFEEDDEVWFTVRHGEMMNRAESVKESGQSDLAVFRPVAHDVVIYDRERDEIRTNVKSKWQLDLYRKTFGRLIFGDESYFGTEAKYTLEPLRDNGEDSLACAEVDEIESIALREVEVLWGGGDDVEYVRHRGKDLFKRWKKSGRTFPGGTIRRASFAIKFADAKTPRTVTVGGSTKLIVSRDHDQEPVERWLEANDFLIKPIDEQEEGN